MKRIPLLLAAAAVLLVVATPASAQTFEVPLDTVIEAPPGSVTLLRTWETPHELVGVACSLSVTATNQSSVHPGNDLIVDSGDGTIALSDVEDAPDGVTSVNGTLTLGSTVTVSLRMGHDGIFSGGAVVSGNCPPSTTTTTTEPSTTTTAPTTPPAIEIVKTASPERYGEDGVGHFMIEVSNPGPVDLTDVYVTDDVALSTDPASACTAADLPDLAVGESYAYSCTVGNLGGAPFTNEATAFGTGPDGRRATDTDDATVFPPVLSTTITTQPPTTAPTTVPPTLPTTGVPFERVRGFSIAGLAFILTGIALLGAASYLGSYRLAEALGHYELWLALEPIEDDRTFYLRLLPADAWPRESGD